MLRWCDKLICTGGKDDQPKTLPYKEDNMYCTYCGSKLHTEANCPKTAGGQIHRRDMRCAYCGAKDHYIEVCKKKWPDNSENPDDYYIQDKYDA